MVHADASNFPRGVLKTEAYAQVIEQASALFDGQRNWVCNLANSASLIWHALHSMPEPSNHANWAGNSIEGLTRVLEGFYVLDPTTPKQLILGPFMGKVACQTIKFGRGVCGKAAETAETQVIEDVHSFPDHIACDGDSRSEIVVPIRVGGKVVAVIDVDSTVPKAFDEEDKKALESLAEILGTSCDW
ncbi:uncharacterized protein LAJ45_08320 [Morchella importuna]|uniref:uncharacterized protein n=1 Tax=Morchella importuna TaxID=1174673 RepID=UPI001E8D956C|nr:uncharacterized protein LAJ45_08320 [Morchella importuna]KAH8147493.1 hypothetical protein LAJ45_08320 [Morchella importuna]